MERGFYRGFPSQVDTEQRRPKRLALATSTVAQTGITSDVDVTGLTISFTVTDYPVEVEYFIPWLTAVTASCGGWAYIADGASAAQQYCLWGFAGTADNIVVLVKERITTPGAYVRKGRIGRTTGTGTLSILADLASVTAYIKATEVEV